MLCVTPGIPHSTRGGGGGSAYRESAVPVRRRHAARQFGACSWKGLGGAGGVAVGSSPRQLASSQLPRQGPGVGHDVVAASTSRSRALEVSTTEQSEIGLRLRPERPALRAASEASKIKASHPQTTGGPWHDKPKPRPPNTAREVSCVPARWRWAPVASFTTPRHHGTGQRDHPQVWVRPLPACCPRPVRGSQ